MRSRRSPTTGRLPLFSQLLRRSCVCLYILICVSASANEVDETITGRAISASDSEGEESLICGTFVTNDDLSRAQATFKNLSVISKPIGRRQQLQPLPSYTFDVQWWVVASNFTYAGGWIPDSQIEAQMAMLNRDYAGLGISWNHIGTGRILHKYWHEVVTTTTISHLMQMQSAFKVMRPDVLNIYTLGFYNEPGVNGASTIPINYIRNPIADGILMLYDLLPGGKNPRRQGSVLTHEAGHWLGLAHTFEGGCFGPGDGVDDTPPQRRPTSGCPVGIDTCFGDGPDPIHNWMDYSDEGCQREFTPGQVDLIYRSIEAFRSPSSVQQLH